MDIGDETILTRYHNPQRKGFDGSGSHCARGDNPFCGDTIELRLFVCEGTTSSIIESARFEGYACSLCTVACDVLMEHIEGRKVTDVRKLNREDLLQLLGGLEVGRTRMGCVELPLTVLHRALGE